MFDFFKSKEERQLAKLLEETSERTKRQYAPISKLGSEIIRAAFQSKERTKHLIQITDEKKRLEREVYVFFEHVYFFSFFATMHVSALLTPEKADQTLKFVGDLVPTVAIDTYFAHWPEEWKKKMLVEFVEKSAVQGDEYFTVLESAPSYDEKFAGAFGLLAENIVRLCEREKEWKELGPAVFDIIFDEARTSRFDLITKHISETE